MRSKKTKTALILGSGLNMLSNDLKYAKEIYRDESAYHRLRVLEGKLFGNDAIIFCGRRHYYEGYNISQIRFLVDLAAQLETDLLMITNAAGGISPVLNISDLMIITSYISLLRANSAMGVASFPRPTSNVNYLKAISAKTGLGLKFGTYCCVNGPNYETPSEIRMLKNAGTDAVGMSTIPEIIRSSQLGIKTISVSCISNLVSESGIIETSHEDVVKACGAAYHRFSIFVNSVLENKNDLMKC